MSRIITVQRNLSETKALLRSFEAAIADDPLQAELLRHDVKSLSKLERQLRAEFSEAADSMMMDEFRYRMFCDGDNPPLLPVVSILREFQNLVSLIFHSMESRKPLTTERLDAASIALTSFRFGYSFEGSVGFVLTLPNERLLSPEMTTLVDDAIATTLALPDLATTSAVRDMASQFGKPIIQACYRWAELHSKHQIGSEASWQRRNEVRSRMFVQYQELDRLRNIINETSEPSETIFTCEGVLIAANVKTRSFLFSMNGADDISGNFEDAISDCHTATIPARYVANIRKKSITNYAKGEDTCRYFLLSLRPI